MIRRPVLAPGLRVLRHPSGEVQIGLGPDHQLRVPDGPQLRRALALLERGETLPDTAEFRRTRRLLAPVLRDGDTLRHPAIDPAEVAAVSLRHPTTTKARLDARQQCRIAVVGSIGHDPTALIEAAGLTLDTDDRPEAVLVLSRGEPLRGPLDDLVRAGVPHLVIRAVEAAIVVGPFVLPGRSCCLRCWDLHQCTVDPDYPALLNDTLGSQRRDGVVEPVPASLSWIALGWAVADLIRYAEGERATTESAFARIDDTGDYRTRPLPAHPACSCTWARYPAVDRSATMEHG